MKQFRIASLGALVGLFLVSFFLRAYYPASWSDQKLYRSIRFASRLMNGRWAETYQQYHPGVPMLAASGLTIRFYQSVEGTPAQALFDWAIPPYVTDLGRDVALGVFGLAIALAGLIVALTLTLQRLGGRRLAWAGAGLLTFSPYFLTQSRIVQGDALLGSFMLLSALLLLTGLQTGQRRYLLLSGFTGGLALLTKTPSLFLIPFTGLTLLAYLVRDVRGAWDQHGGGRARWLLGEAWRGLVGPGLLWGVVAALAFALWPAMWVDPLGTLQKVVLETRAQVSNPVPQSIFLAGRLYVGEDPGPLFYAVTLAFNSTFVTLTLGLVALGFYTVWRKRVTSPPVQPLTFWLLVAYAVFFTIQMSLGGKRYGRYVLPTHLAMEVLGAVGLVGLTGLLQRAVADHRPRLARALPGALAGLAIGLQALVTLPFAPDYGAHHNYLLGGNQVAVRVMEIVERNEGMLFVGDYLSRQPGAASQQLVTWFPVYGSALQYFPGEVEQGTAASEGDYYVFGLATMQRQYRPERWEARWNALREKPPRLVVSYDGVEFIWLYAAQDAETDQTIVKRRGWAGFTGMAWAWTVGMAATLVWALRSTSEGATS